MADLDAIANTSPSYHRRGCSVSSALYAMRARYGDAGEELIAIVARKADDPNVSTTEVARLLSKHGVEVSVATVRRHRRRAEKTGCTCPVTAA